MMKNIVLFNGQNISDIQSLIDAESIEDVRLKDCLRSSNLSSKPKIEALLEISQNEELFDFEENDNYYSVRLACDFKAPKLLAANGAPYVPVNYPIWIGKNEPWCITQDAGRKLSSVGIALVSYTITSDPLAYMLMRATKVAFQSVIDKVVNPDDGGQIKRISCENVVVDGTEYKQIILGANQLQDSSLFSKVLSSSAWISSMTFVSPPLVSSDREVVCRLNDWGGLTVYSPDVLDSEVLEVVQSIYSVLSQIDDEETHTKRRKGRKMP